jgi:UDP:flavonoid glycosyltransferase YjiC (YdhE family)
MHALLVSIGTDGDIFPYIGLGDRLRRRGHRVTLVASGHYEAKAVSHGFGFRPLITAAENRALLGNPDFWNPLKVAPLAGKWGMRLLEPQLRLLSELAADLDAVLVSSPAILASGLVHERFGRPLANLVLQPWMIPSSVAPPVMPLLDLRRWPRPLVRLFWRSLDVVVDGLIGRRLNRIRADIGLKPTRRILSGWFSSQLIVGLFPEWYGPLQNDWPNAVRLVGFPMFDGGGDNDAMPAEVAAFCRSGPPPVAVAFGSEMMHAAPAFHALIDVLARLGLRGIVLTKYRDQLPKSLPASVIHCAFAPFQKLFPLCSAVVHHGGIGTTAKALASGTPQLVLPFGFDQMDNAARVEGLGVGLSVRFKAGRTAAIETGLQRLLAGEKSEGCRRAQQRFVAIPNALETAADLVEGLAD